MNVDDVLNQAKATAGIRTDMALAERLGITRAAVSNWRHGTKSPDPVACEKLAVLSGIPLHRVLGIVGEARAISTDEKRVWRKLAAAIALSVLLAPAAFASAILTGMEAAKTPAVGCIMRKVRRFLARLAQALQRPSHDQSPAVLA